MQVTEYDDQHLAGMVELVRAVTALGGAVGWLTVPAPEEVRSWLTELLGSGARLWLIETEGRVVACAALQRFRAPVVSKMAQVIKVMTHPDARGTGAGRALLGTVVEQARREGVEVLTLGCRGNNHGAQRLYADVGFVVTGRRPDALSVGDERFDEVLMHLDLRRGTSGLQRHGSRPEGPGAT